MEQVINMTYTSSLTNLCEINSSFDTGILRIAYPGENRNKSSISKEVFEKCIRTMYNCPVVCHYDRETDTIGGHDMEAVRKEDGTVKLVNLTTPIGVVPECAKYWWAPVTEDDGTVREYLHTEILLWKRQEAYAKIKRDGITAQSMELTIKDGKMVDGVYQILDFEFNAFAVIGCTPCFESASVEVFAAQDFKQKFSEMMKELKESYSLVTSPAGDTDKHPQEKSKEGGEKVLEDKLELVAKYGINTDTLDFSIDDFTVEELTEKFEAMKASADEPVQEDGAGEEPAEESAHDEFALTSNVIDEICRALGEEKVQCEWGERPRYWYVDCDLEANQVYCWDTGDWLLYGFTYTMDGDNVRIDYESKQRKKYVIADFDEGEQASPFADVYAKMEQKIHENSELEAKYQTASDTITTMESELGELRKFKADADKARREDELTHMFEEFSDLVGVEAFEALRENNDDYDVEALKEKCYAIRGKNVNVAKFALESTTPKLKVSKSADDAEYEDDPYGGVVAKFGVRHS